MHMLHVCDDVIMMNDMMVLVKRMYAYCNVTHPTVRGAVYVLFILHYPY